MSELANRLRAGRNVPNPDTAPFVERATADGLLDVAYATVDSPFGPLLVALTPAGLVRLAYADERHDDVLDDLAARVSPRVLEAPARLGGVRRDLDEYFAGRRRGFQTPIDWSLTSGFGRRVLRATFEDPVRRGLDLPGDRGGGRQPQRLTCRRQRAGRQPDPDRGALPSRAAHRAAAWVATRAAWTARSGCCTSKGCSSDWSAFLTARPA